MIQGEPLEVNTASEDDSAPVAEKPKESWNTSDSGDQASSMSNDFLARTFETQTDKLDDADHTESEDLDALLDEAEEDVRDALWMSAEASDEIKDKSAADESNGEQKHTTDQVLTLPERQEFQQTADVTEPKISTSIAQQDQEADAPSEMLEETDALLETVIASQSADTENESDTMGSAVELELPKSSPKAAPEPSSSLLSLQAINLLNEKIATTESRYDGALNKIGHALGVIAERIDGLETRITNQTITNVAIAADPKPVDDGTVAPYIAQAERELQAKKESGPVDIFDRIARAAETEYESQRGTGTKIIADAGDGRRVGTKRWQPSKTVKKRMEQLEKARTLPTGTEATDTDEAAEIAVGTAANPAAMQENRAFAEADAEPTVTERTSAGQSQVFDEDDEEFDEDSGLSVVPGARGRRKNRARKSRLDEDFEDVFAEGDGEPSIQNLRRKMRQKPAEEDEQPAIVEETPKSEKSGLLGGILGKKKSKAPVELNDELDEDEDDLELMAAFDDELDIKPKKKSKKTTKLKVTDEIDETPDRVSFLGGPLLYAAIAGAAGLAFFIWQKFLA